jgi:hypothetical protein
MTNRCPLYAVAVIGAKDKESLIKMGWKASPYQPHICWEFVEHLQYPAKKLARMIRDATDADAVHVYRGRGARGRLIAMA